ncbi:heterokaryon incompatibility protein-domain-containing protein [Xylaria curta]|nr:heterokaryon incompatibility protein-domain-containing protein [Xylaria curta]
MAYVYEPLPQNSHTRVLELSPALDPNTPLHGNFRFVNLDKDPFYDAISYTWGDPHFTEEIFIGENSRLCITPNLRDALVRFRQPTEVRSIWVDAVCIDQANEEDKRRQIPSMGDIFRCASSVLVWLGKEPWGEACLWKISLLSQRKTAPTTSDMDEISSILSQLVSLSWFSRRWVIQELVLNPNVFFFCGAISIPWLRAAQLLKIFPKENLSPQILHLYKLRETWDSHNRSKHRIPPESGVLHMLSNFRETDCSDPRDRIYALIGIASDVVFEDYDTRQEENKIFIRIDYTQTVEQLYHDFAVAVQQSGGNNQDLLLLETALRFNFSHKGELALWMPDWRLPIVRSQSSTHGILKLITSLSNQYRRSYSDFCFGKIEDIIHVPYPKIADRSAKLAWLRDVFTLIRERFENDNDVPLRHQLDSPWNVIASAFTLQPYHANLNYRRYDDESAVLETLELGAPPRVIENCCLFTILFNRKRSVWPLIGIGPCGIRSGDTLFASNPLSLSTNTSGHDLIVLRADESQSAVKRDGLYVDRAWEFVAFAFTPMDTYDLRYY